VVASVEGLSGLHGGAERWPASWVLAGGTTGPGAVGVVNPSGRHDRGRATAVWVRQWWLCVGGAVCRCRASGRAWG
jgi:hypothetical protein